MQFSRAFHRNAVGFVYRTGSSQNSHLSCVEGGSPTMIQTGLSHRQFRFLNWFVENLNMSLVDMIGLNDKKWPKALHDVNAPEQELSCL